MVKDYNIMPNTKVRYKELRDLVYNLCLQDNV
jgi:hypothetical protein